MPAKYDQLVSAIKAEYKKKGDSDKVASNRAYATATKIWERKYGQTPRGNPIPKEK